MCTALFNTIIKTDALNFVKKLSLLYQNTRRFISYWALQSFLITKSHPYYAGDHLPHLKGSNAH